MRKKLSTTLVAATLVVLLIGGAAFAAAQLGVAEMFAYRDAETGQEFRNELVDENVQPINQVYDGNAIRFEVTDGVYDKPGASYALNWSFEKKNDGDSLYIVCDGITFGGAYGCPRSFGGMTEFLLEDGVTYGGVIGELPEDATGECEISYYILRPIAEIEVAGDGTVENIEWSADLPYNEALLASGLFEVADQFTLSFTMDGQGMQSAVRTVKGDTHFVFDDYELNITEAYLSATSCHITVEYITPEIPADGGKGVGPLWGLEFTVPELDYWHSNGGGSWEDPVQLEDGRWKSVYTFEALGIHVNPDEITMTLVTYDEDLLNPTMHTDEAVTLKFE